MSPQSARPVTASRMRHLSAGDGFGSLTLAPTNTRHRPASRFFCLEAPLFWRPARSARTTPPATTGLRPAPPARALP